MKDNTMKTIHLTDEELSILQRAVAQEHWRLGDERSRWSDKHFAAPTADTAQAIERLDARMAVTSALHATLTAK
jgi:hypothetical protein